MEHLTGSDIIKVFDKNFNYEIAKVFGANENTSKSEVDEIMSFAREVRQVTVSIPFSRFNLPT